MTTVDQVHAPTKEHPTGAPPLGDTWPNFAACRPGTGVDPELFFPIGDGRPSRAQEAEAKEVCWQCPAATDCLRWALETGHEYGVAGGLAERERRVIRRRMGPRFRGVIQPARVETPDHEHARH